MLKTLSQTVFSFRQSISVLKELKLARNKREKDAININDSFSISWATALTERPAHIRKARNQRGGMGGDSNVF